MAVAYKSLLHEMACTTQTDYWNDSCALAELTYALENGAVGATTNPTIVLQVLKQELGIWKERIAQLIRDHADWSEVELGWKISEEMAVRGAELLYPVFEREGGRKGRISLQTNPSFFRNTRAIVEQGKYFATLAPNIQVKVPATAAGIRAAEELTYQGVVVNVTVSFTVPQALAIGEAVESGLRRREAEGKPVEGMTPNAVLMIGRMDDWLQVLIKRDQVADDPGFTNWAGIAVFKRAYEMYQERGYRARLLAAAMRHYMHWSELIGADAVITIPYEWQLLFNNSGVAVKNRIADPVDERIVSELLRRFPDFRRGYEPQGMAVEEFDAYGATARTLRSFTAAYADLLGLMREYLLPNPDVKGKDKG
jgi:transaldolase